MDNDGVFYVGILVDNLPCCKSSVCVGSMTTYVLVQKYASTEKCNACKQKSYRFHNNVRLLRMHMQAHL